MAVRFPVFLNSRMSASKAATLSNLRQCFVALSLYTADYDGDQSMPRYEVAVAVIPPEATCDNADYWRRGCAEATEQPLIGSYGYVRGTAMGLTEQDWRDYLAAGPEGKTLLICPFYASTHLQRFTGESIPSTCGPPVQQCMFPDRLIGLRLDGSVVSRSNSIGGPYPRGGLLFTWSVAFALRLLICLIKTLFHSKRP